MQNIPQNLTDLTTLFNKQLNVALTPAGVWKFNADGKKQAIDPYRQPHEKLVDRPKDNMLRADLKGEVLVIDVDYKKPKVVEIMYPTIANTLYTTTTTPDKRHYYLLPPTDKKWRQTRSVGNDGIDYLTNGVIFEGHIFDDPNTQYSINNTEILQATEEEFSEIEEILGKAPVATTGNLTEYVSKELRDLVKLYLKEDELDNQKNNRLCRLTMNKAYNDENKGKRGRLSIEPTYMNANTIAIKLSCNVAITTDLRDQFLEKWVKDEWGFERNSKQTRQFLDKGILPSLPQRTAVDLEATTLEEMIDAYTMDGYTLVKTIVSGQLMYFQIDPMTMTPRRVGKDEGFLFGGNTLKGLYEDEANIKLALHDAPLVTITDNPYKGVTEWDGEQRLNYFNVARRTEYEMENSTLPDLPDNPITRSIASYFGSEHVDLYLHWLAHVTLAPSSPILIPFFVSTKDDSGRSGKSLNASVLPSALAYAVSTISPDTMTGDWGDSTSSARLVALNDMPKMSDKDWNNIYGKMRDETSPGMRRRKNMKYSGFVEVTDTYAISVSANYIPSLDAHDRRGWVVLPQHLEYGDTEPVSKEDAKWLMIFAKMHIDNRYEELSDLMAYLRYLYTEHRDKYYEELYIKAPETKGRDMAISKGTTYSSRIIYSIQSSPESLWELMLEDALQFVSSYDVPLGITPDSTVTQQQIAQFIVMQYDGQGKVWLPSQFLAEIQHRIANSDTVKYIEKHNVVASLCGALQIEKSKFKQTSPQHYITKEKLAKAGLPKRMFRRDKNDIHGYSQRMIAITVGEPQIELWREEAENGH